MITDKGLLNIDIVNQSITNLYDAWKYFSGKANDQQHSDIIRHFLYENPSNELKTELDQIDINNDDEDCFYKHLFLINNETLVVDTVELLLQQLPQMIDNIITIISSASSCQKNNSNALVNYLKKKNFQPPPPDFDKHAPENIFGLLKWVGWLDEYAELVIKFKQEQGPQHAQQDPVTTAPEQRGPPFISIGTQRFSNL